MINICLRCQRDCKSEKAVCGKFKSIDDKGYKRAFKEYLYKAIRNGYTDAVNEIIEQKKNDDETTTS